MQVAYKHSKQINGKNPVSSFLGKFYLKITAYKVHIYTLYMCVHVYVFVYVSMGVYDTYIHTYIRIDTNAHNVQMSLQTHLQ